MFVARPIDNRAAEQYTSLREIFSPACGPGADRRRTSPMTQKHILSLLVSAALLCGLLAGCSNTNGDASHASSSASEPSSVSSESAPSSTAQADTSGLFNKDLDEN